MKKLILILPLILASLLYGGDIKSGAYTLKMIIPEMPESKRTLNLVGELKAKKKIFTFDTKGAMGNTVILKGKIIKDSIVIWTSGEENGGLVTYHLTGELRNHNDSVAKGEASIFQNHQRVAGGDWSLQQHKSEQIDGLNE